MITGQSLAGLLLRSLRLFKVIKDRQDAAGVGKVRRGKGMVGCGRARLGWAWLGKARVTKNIKSLKLFRYY